MTTNKYTMKNNQYIQMDPVKKIKLKLSTNEKIAYINNYFVELTGFKIHELILKDFDAIIHPDMPKFYFDFIKKTIELGGVNYFIIKGLIKGGDYYYSLLRISTKVSEQNEITGYEVEGKMLPASAIEKTESMMHVLSEIENNAGKDAAIKYFEGHLEEQNMSYNDFVLNMAGIDEKTARKYFELGDEPKKKKKSWF